MSSREAGTGRKDTKAVDCYLFVIILSLALLHTSTFTKYSITDSFPSLYALFFPLIERKDLAERYSHCRQSQPDFSRAIGPVQSALCQPQIFPNNLKRTDGFYLLGWSGRERQRLWPSEVRRDFSDWMYTLSNPQHRKGGGEPDSNLGLQATFTALPSTISGIFCHAFSLFLPYCKLFCLLCRFWNLLEQTQQCLLNYYNYYIFASEICDIWDNLSQKKRYFVAFF